MSLGLATQKDRLCTLSLISPCLALTLAGFFFAFFFFCGLKRVGFGVGWNVLGYCGMEGEEKTWHTMKIVEFSKI